MYKDNMNGLYVTNYFALIVTLRPLNHHSFLNKPIKVEDLLKETIGIEASHTLKMVIQRRLFGEMRREDGLYNSKYYMGTSLKPKNS